MNYVDLIWNRKSIRDFKDKPVSDTMLQEIRSYHDNCHRLVPAIKTELVFLNKEAQAILEGNAGYYGKVFGAPHYLLLLSDSHEYDRENTGYVCEDLLLKMTDMGLDSCWMTLSDGNAICKALDLKTDSSILSVIAFGFGKKESAVHQINIKSPSDIDIVFKKGHLAPKTALTEFVYYQQWGNRIPLDASIADDNLIDAFFGASLTPSYLNIQAYRFILDSGFVALAETVDSLTAPADQRLNRGAIMLNFAVILEMRRPAPIVWHLNPTDLVYELPHDWKIVGCCPV